MKKKLVKIFILLSIAVLIVAIVFYQSQLYLGQQAIDATGLNKMSYQDALALADKDQRYVLADMSAIWCPACRKLNREVLADGNVKNVIKEHYIYTRLEYETDEGKQFMQRHGLKGFPTLLILDSTGNKLWQLPLTFDPELFIDYLKDFIELKKADELV